MALTIPAKRKGVTRVLAFGTFDIIHPGHIYFLKSAKELGDELFVIIARDTTVLKRKKMSSQFTETIRAKNVKKLGIVDYVLLGDPQDYLKIPKAIAPDVIALGYDQEAPIKVLEENFQKTKITRLFGHFPEEFKSSKLRNIFPSS